jgi:hypothetical protein
MISCFFQWAFVVEDLEVSALLIPFFVDCWDPAVPLRDVRVPRIQRPREGHPEAGTSQDWDAHSRGHLRSFRSKDDI